jgi:MEMO1 family protein
MAFPRITRDPAIREARFAGTWYPGEAASLRRSIEEQLSRVTPVKLPGRPLALVSPHAGHRFSAAVAMHAYTQVRNLDINRVVLMGPLHGPIWGSTMGEFMAPSERIFTTPLGQVPVDADFLSDLNQRAPLTFVHNDQEHSLEIELPFLQVVLGPFTLVPLMMGVDIIDPGVPQSLDDLAAALAGLADERTLFVASTDLSHLHNYHDVVRIDKHMVELVDAFDLPKLVRAMEQREVYACGAAALVTALSVAQKRGATGVSVLSCMNSGDITGDKRTGNYTVGYMAAVAYG